MRTGGILPFVEINPRAKIYMQHNAGGEYYAFDGEEKGYRYKGQPLTEKRYTTLHWYKSQKTGAVEFKRTKWMD
jgi:hypothetical protein